MKSPGLKGDLVPRRAPNNPLSKQNLESRESSLEEAEVASFIQVTKPASEDIGEPTYVKAQLLSVDRYLDSSLDADGYGLRLDAEFFDWLQETHSPTWLQPLDEPAGATVTSGMAGPNSSSVTSVTFGEPGLVESDRTAALFNASRIVYPKGAVLDRIHQAAGGTIMFWAQADALMGDEGYIIFCSNNGSTASVGILIMLENRGDIGVSKALRVAVTRGVSLSVIYGSPGMGASVYSPDNAVIPGQTQMFAVSHGESENMRLYVDGSLVTDVAKSNPHSAATSTNDPTVGALRPSDIILPHKGLLQGLTFIPSILTPAQISEIYTRSGI